MADQLENSISEERLWRVLMELARYGATPRGGVNRQAFSPEDIAAKRHVVVWAKERGFDCFQDEFGNLFIRRLGLEPDLSPVMTGSHLDSQPTGGKFDGAYGVVAGLEVLEAFEASGIETRRSVEVVAWSNEEGGRFPASMGSSVFTGVCRLPAVLDLRDRRGISLRDALSETLNALDVPRRPMDQVKPHSYVEAHIEQGPILEAERIPIGVVTGIQGIRRFEVEVVGEEAHAATTPRRSRKDAFLAMVSIVSALEKLIDDPADLFRFTVERCEVFPSSPFTIPGRVTFTFDLRHPDHDVLKSVADRIEEVAARSAKGCSATVNVIADRAPILFDPQVVEIVAAQSETLGYRSKRMHSGAGHDAMHICKICPTGMIFVPCERGISHNEAENVMPGDLAAGARVLAGTLLALAG